LRHGCISEYHDQKIFPREGVSQWSRSDHPAFEALKRMTQMLAMLEISSEISMNIQLQQNIEGSERNKVRCARDVETKSSYCGENLGLPL